MRKSILLIGRREVPMMLEYAARGGSYLFEEKTMLLGNGILVKKHCEMEKRIVIV